MNCFTPTVALLDVLGENILNHYKQHEVTQISKKYFKKQNLNKDKRKSVV